MSACRRVAQPTRPVNTLALAAARLSLQMDSIIDRAALKSHALREVLELEATGAVRPGFIQRVARRVAEEMDAEEVPVAWHEGGGTLNWAFGDWVGGSAYAYPDEWRLRDRAHFKPAGKVLAEGNEGSFEANKQAAEQVVDALTRRSIMAQGEANGRRLARHLDVDYEALVAGDETCPCQDVSIAGEEVPA